MEELRVSIAEMLRGGHIASFVYVDDRFGNALVDKAESKIHVSQHIADVGIITNPEIWEDQFEDWWRDTPEEEKQRICLGWGLSADGAENLKHRFEQILPDTIERRYLTPDQFGQERDAIVANLDEDHQLMLLVDYVLEGYGRNGEDVLEPIAQRDYVNCAVFSGTFHTDNELEQWINLKERAYIFKISKDRVDSGNDNDIMEGLRSVLWLKQITRIKEQTKQFVGDASKYLYDHLDEIDPITFHKVVLDRSETEGCWEFETLMRIVYAYLGLGLKNTIQAGGFESFQLLTSNLRNIKSNAKAHSVNESIINAISREEIYASGDYINGTFSQICNGDIFNIGRGSGKEYILLCQPCNLEIRSDGYRARREFDQFYLIPIREYKEDKDKGNKLIESLKKVEGEPQLVAELSHYVRISLSLLDLVSFNEKGRSIIDLTKTAENHPHSQVIQKNMMLRYDMILKKILLYKSKYDRIQGADWSNEEKEMLKRDFCHPFEMGDEKVTKHPLIKANNPNEIDFSITRVRRYNDPYAKDLLNLFMNYLSRPGYPMELNME